MTTTSTMDDTMAWLKERVHDKRHFTARQISNISEASGMEKEFAAKAAVGMVAAFLMFSEQAHIISNFLLFAIPFQLIFIYPDEKPTDRSLSIYFSLFGILTVFDRSLEKVPMYYIFKLALFLLLYIPPYRLVDILDVIIEQQIKQHSEEASVRTALAPSTTTTANNITVQSTQPASEYKGPSTAPPASDTKDADVKNLKSSTDIAGESQRLKHGQNPMEVGSSHKLRSDASDMNVKVVGPGNNLNDMLFFPMDCLVFNAPFDYENLTYHMKVINNSHHRIAYAVKGNAVPRVMVHPPFAILNSKQPLLVAVTVQRFEWNSTDFEKDRVAFDYVILPDTNKEKQFSMKMLQDTDAKRRKNIKIMYNP